MDSWLIYANAMTASALAVFGGIIAYRQWRTARTRLQLDLFDRRLKIFEAINKVIVACGGGKVPNQDEQLDFLCVTQSTRWLFSDEIVELKKSVWNRMCELEALQGEAPPERGSERTQNGQDQASLREWFQSMAARAEEMFAEYLMLRD